MGSRKSELALIQTRHVIAELGKLRPDITVNITRYNDRNLQQRDIFVWLMDGFCNFDLHDVKDTDILNSIPRF